ncbi:MAG: TVP38/TMEM64 family protein [Caulobacterales bacterium]|nr:TVP38/TMEM64 family protein [Caulobacterales bacterium]
MTAAPSRKLERLPRLVGFAILGIVTLAGFAAPFLPGHLTQGLGVWLAAAHSSPWAPLVAMLGFAALATLGVPQIVLITAVVAAFGPWWGLLYSWGGKMMACTVGFFIGRRFGARILAAYSGPKLQDFMQRLTKHGFWASALIRMVPTVPSVLINIAAGATPIRTTDFLAGTALGSVPKMALMAFGGAAALEAVRHPSWGAVAALVAVLVLWAALAFASKRWLGKSRPPGETAEPSIGDAP